MAALLIANALVVISVIVYVIFFYKWDNKTYDDLAENVGNRFDKVEFAGEMYLGEGASNIESLLGKDDASI